MGAGSDGAAAIDCTGDAAVFLNSNGENSACGAPLLPVADADCVDWEARRVAALMFMALKISDIGFRML
jgi:hypothetical protein